MPVLSSTTVLHFPQSSSASAFLKSIPCVAPTPLATIIATGVASPNAQGQLITNTDIAHASAKPAVSPTASHIISVINEMSSTAGTNTADTLSAILAIGAFVAAASLTALIICERVLSSPTAVARQTSLPVTFIVADDTLLPANLSTGMLSPVSDDSSTAPEPSVTIPSAGNTSPALTINISSFKISSASIIISSPFLITVAVLGANSISDFMALVVLPFAYCSKSLPTVISVNIIAADSK